MLQPRGGKGREGPGSPPEHKLTCPVIRESSQGDNLPSRLPSYKLPSIRGLQEPAKTQRPRERSGSPGRTPHAQMFLAMFSVEVSLGAERGGGFT